MTPAALGLEIRRSRVLLIGLAVVTGAYAAFISLFYANVAENAAQFEQLLKIYPREILVAFGIEGGFADPGVFLTGYVFNFLWPLIAAFAAIALGTRIASDVDRGWADVALSTPLDRRRLLLSSIATQLIVLVVLAVVMVAGILVADLFITPNFPTANVALTTLPSVAFGLALAGPSTALAVLLLDRGRAAGIVAGVLVVMYLLNVVAALAPDVGWLADLSAFHYFSLKGLIGSGTFPIGDTLLLAGVGIVGWLGALVLFRGRDLAA